MEEAMAGQIKNTQEVAPDAEKKGKDQQGFPRNFQGKNIVFSQAQNQFGQQVQAKALNQVTTYINTRMDNMFTDLSTKYDTVASHIRRWMLRLLKQLEVSRGSKAHKREQSTVLALKRLLPTILQRPPVRFYVPKFPYPIPPKHLMDPINAGSWLALTPPLMVFPKVEDPGKFSFPCSIAGVEFKGALSDSGSSVNLVSKEIFDELGIVDVEPSLVTHAFGNSSTAVPYGTICNLPVQVGDCMLHTEFQVVEMSKDHEMPLIFGMSFFITAGAIIDLPNNIVSFSNINEKEFGDKSEIKEVLDGDSHTDIKELNGNAKVKEKIPGEKGQGRPYNDYTTEVNGATCPLKRAAAPGEDVTMEHVTSPILATDLWNGPWDEGTVSQEKGKNEEKELGRAKEELNELDELGELENWSSTEWNVHRLGGLDGFGVVVSSWLDQVRSWTGPTKPCAVGNMSSSWSWFLAEGALSLRKHKTRSESKGKPKERTWAFSREDLIGIRPRRQSNHRILKIDPNMVDLREKAKQTANGTPERTSKDRVMDHGLDPVRSCDLMLKCWIR
ncbi:hypothetical protein DY000_02015011 [Brassica cretica]|uniref:Aspartic peptidase DDI1-type domain-containing protein n=1 Tax=Brassica cretica TaxID=69181 RepID=A0ABQ7DDD5_BRACR|nr:hypothetical protein DY000_02015011 [Brassica cretica]